MSELWGVLLPLALTNILVCAPFTECVLLARASGRNGAAWIAGDATVRLLQGAVFGLVLSGTSTSVIATVQGRAVMTASLLLIASVIMFRHAAQAASLYDSDAPAPEWMEMVDAVRPSEAFVYGARKVGADLELWIFTLTAIAALEQSSLDGLTFAVTYLGFVILVLAPQLVVLSFAARGKSLPRSPLDRAARWLQRHNHLTTMLWKTGFGLWFLAKSLKGFGVI